MKNNKWTTIILHKTTVEKLKEIGKTLENKFKVKVSLERVIIELLDAYEKNQKEILQTQVNSP